MERSELIRRWAETASGKIKYKPDRAETVEELAGHMEDKMEALLARGMSPEEAEHRAVEAMGDPEAVAEEMAKAHSPWPGHVRQIVLGVLIFAVAVFVFHFGVRAALPTYEQLAGPIHSIEAQAQKAYFDGAQGALLNVPKQAVSAGDYKFSVSQACLWEGDAWVLYCQLEALSVPWSPPDDAVLKRIWAEDSTGRRYEEDCVMVSGWALWAPWAQRAVLAVEDIDPEAEWVEFHYDLLGCAFSLRLPLR